MTRPTVSPTSEAWYARLPEYLRDADSQESSGGGYPLLRFMSLLGDQLDDVNIILDRINYVAPDDGGPPDSTSDLVNAQTADPSWLPWLAQLYGVDLSSAVTLQSQRDAIASAATGWQAGSKPSLASAAASALTGQKFVEIIDHLNGNPWVLGIQTRTTETPDVQALLRAATYAKPAGYVLQLINYASSWDEIEADLPNWTEIETLGSWTLIEELGLGSEESQVWIGTKARFGRTDGGFAQKLTPNDWILSEQIGWALREAVVFGDKAEFVLTNSFAINVMERTNAGSGVLSGLGTAGAGLNLMAYKVNNNSGGTASVIDWNWQIGADIDRAFALIQAGEFFYEQQGDPDFSTYLAEGVAIAKQILQYSTIKKGDKRYLATDSYQNVAAGGRTNSGSYPGGIIEHNSSFADFAAFEKFAETDLINHDEWIGLINGELDVLTATMQPSGPLGTTPSLPVDWSSWKLDTLLPGPITSGTDGWTYTRPTTFGYEAFKILYRLYWWWSFYSDPRALNIFNAVLPFFRTWWSAHSNSFVDTWTHAGAGATTAPKTYIATAIRLAAKAVNDTDFADAIKTADLTGIFEKDGTGAYWADKPDGTGGTSSESMFWSNMGFTTDHGLWTNP